MKTLKFVLLCFIVVFAIGTVKAQNSVIKEDVVLFICGESQKVPCTGDYICGSATFQFMFMKKNWIIKGKDSDSPMIGYHNPDGTDPSGNVYEISQVSPGLNNYVNHVLYRLNGKLVAELQVVWRITTNANGDVTAVVDKFMVNCMNQ
jgi:hypothetical protein